MLKMFETFVRIPKFLYVWKAENENSNTHALIILTAFQGMIRNYPETILGIVGFEDNIRKCKYSVGSALY